MSSLHHAHGLDVIDARVFYGTNYAYFFIPAFILVSLYEMTLQALNLRNSAATVILTAKSQAIEEGVLDEGHPAFALPRRPIDGPRTLKGFRS